MFRVSITQRSKEGDHVLTFDTEALRLFVNRYPNGHPLAGNVKDIRVVRVEDDKNVGYTFIDLIVRVLQEGEE